MSSVRSVPEFPELREQALDEARVYWYTDWISGVHLAIAELWRSVFGCHHDWRTIRFQHITHAQSGEWGTWAVNRCVKCGRVHPHATWGGEA